MGLASNKVSENLARVRQRIALAASRTGRPAEAITLVAVSKTHSAEAIQGMYESGVRHFGENRVQEQESKSVRLDGLGIIWHMIGHVQKNKAVRAVRLFDTIDSVDSIALAEKLDQARNNLSPDSEKDAEKEKGKGNPKLFAVENRLRVLIEVRLDPEPAKSGVSGEELPQLVEAIERLPYLDLRGLMGVPPYFDEAEQARPFFRRLRMLRDEIRARHGQKKLPVLSMGMSHDLEIAIEEGATEVRVGTALFGERERA